MKASGNGAGREDSPVELGSSGHAPAMTLDEIVVLDRTLSANEIQACEAAVKVLAQVRFPVGWVAD